MRSALSEERNKLTTLCRGADVGHEVTPYRQRIWMPTKSMRPYSVAGCVPWAAKPTLSLNTGDKAQKSKAFIWMPAAAAVTGWPLTLCHHIVGRNAVGATMLNNRIRNRRLKQGEGPIWRDMQALASKKNTGKRWMHTKGDCRS